ncbi:MAG: hypothetical protein HZRFUVUK_001774 [Candidatus Fervidibacterota bacterium]
MHCGASVAMAKRSGRLITALVVLIYIVVMLVFAVLSIRKLLPKPEELVSLIRTQFEVSTGAKMSVESTSGSTFSSLKLRGVRIGLDSSSPTGAAIVCERIEIGLNLIALLRWNKLRERLIRKVTLYSPTLYLHRDEKGIWNFQKLFKPKKLRPPTFLIRLVVVDGRAIYEDEITRLVSGKALRLRVHNINGKVTLHPDGFLTWDVSGRGEGRHLRKVASNGIVRATGELSARTKVSVCDLTPTDAPEAFMKALQKYVGWGGGMASFDMVIDTRRCTANKPRTTIRCVFDVANPSIALKSLLKESLLMETLKGSACLMFDSGKLSEGYITAHAVREGFGSANASVSFDGSSLDSRITLLNVPLRALQETVKVFDRLPYGLRFIKGKAKLIDLAIRKAHGKPAIVRVNLSAYGIIATSSLIKSPAGISAMDVQGELMRTDGRLPVGRLVARLHMPSRGRVAGACIDVNLSLWENILSGDVNAINLSATSLNILGEGLLPFTGKLCDGMLNLSFAFKAPRGKDGLWVGGEVELSDVSVRRLMVDKLRQWHELFPHGTDVKGVSGVVRYDNGIWQILGVGFSHSLFDGAISGEFIASKRALSLTAKLFGVDLPSTLEALRKTLLKGGSYGDIDVKTLEKGDAELRLLMAGGKLVSGLELRLPRMSLSHGSFGEAHVAPTHSSVRIVHVYGTQPKKSITHVESEDVLIRNLSLFSTTQQIEFERVEPSSVVEFFDSVRLSRARLQLGDEVRLHSEVSAKTLRVFGLTLSDAHFEMDSHGKLIELRNIEAELAGGRITCGVASVEHNAGRELTRAEFSCDVEGVRLASVLDALDMTQQKVFADGRASGKFSISQDGKELRVICDLRIDAPVGMYEAVGTAEPLEVKSKANNLLSVDSVKLSGNSLRLQLRLTAVKHRKVYEFGGCAFTASLDVGRARLLTADGRMVDAPIKSAFINAVVDPKRIDVKHSQCIAWDAKVRCAGGLSFDGSDTQLQLLFSELNLNDLQGLFKEELFGRVDGYAVLRNDAKVKELRVRLSASKLALRRSREGNEKVLRLPFANATLAWDGKRLEVVEANAHYADTPFEITGYVSELSRGIEKASMYLRARAQSVNIGKLIRELGLEADVEGLGNVEALISGTIEAPKVEANISMPLPMVCGLAFESLSAHVVYDGERKQVEVSPARLQLAGGKVSASATVTDLAGSRRVSGKLMANDIQLEWVARQLMRKVNIEGVISSANGLLSGTLASPHLSMQMKLERLKLHGVEVGGGSSTLSLRRLREGEHTLTAHLMLTPKEGSIALRLSMERKGQRTSTDLRCDGDGVDLAWLEKLFEAVGLAFSAVGEKGTAVAGIVERMAKLPHPINGTVDFAFAHTGSPDGEQWRLECKVKELQMGQSERYTLYARLSGDGKSTRVDELNIVQRGAVAKCVGTVGEDGELDLKVSLNKMRLQALAQLLRLRMPLDAVVTAEAQVGGSTKRPVLDITGEFTNIRHKGISIERMELKAVRYSDGRLIAKRGALIVHQGGQAIALWGRLPVSVEAPFIPPKETLDAHIQVADAPITLLRAFTIPVSEKSVGQFTVDLHLAGTWENPTLGGVLAIKAPKLSLRDEAVVLNDVEVSVTAEGKRTLIERCSFGVGGGKVSVGGYIQFGKEALVSPVANEFKLNIDVSNLPIKVSDAASVGKLSASMLLQNTPDENGPMLRLLSASILGQPEALKAGGVAQWERKVWSSWDVFKRGVFLKALMMAKCDIAFSLKRLHIRLKDIFEGRVSGKLMLVSGEQVNNAQGTALNGGSVGISGVHTMPMLVGSVTLHDGLLRGIPPISAQRRTAIVSQPFPALDVTINVGGNVELRNVQVSAPIRGQITVKGSPSMPRVAGRLYADRGALRLPGGVLRLVVADVQIAVSPGAEVGSLQSSVNLNVEARGKVGNYDVTMRASGPLQEGISARWLSVHFASTPPLAEQEIARRLFGIELPEGTLAEAVAPTLQRMFVSAVGGGLAEALGLEQLVVEEEAGKQRLGIGARISPSLYIRWYQGLTGQGNIIEVEQWLGKHASVIWRQDERQQKNEFRVQVQFQF